MQEELSWFDTGSNVKKKRKGKREKTNWITDAYAHIVYWCTMLRTIKKCSQKSEK